MELRSLFITDAHKGILKTLEAGGGWGGGMGICKDKFSIKNIDNRMQSEETQAKKKKNPINWLLSSRSDSLAQAF